MGLYDVLALAGSRGKKTVPVQKHLSKALAHVMQRLQTGASSER